MCQPTTQTQVELLKYHAAPGAPFLKDALWLLHSRRETSNKSVPAHQHISFQFFKVFCFFFQICSYFPPSVIKVEWPIQSLHWARMCGHQARSSGLALAVAKGTPLSQKLNWGRWISTHMEPGSVGPDLKRQHKSGGAQASLEQEHTLFLAASHGPQEGMDGLSEFHSGTNANQHDWLKWVDDQMVRIITSWNGTMKETCSWSRKEIPSFIFYASKFVRVFGLQFTKIGLHQNFLRWLYIYIYFTYRENWKHHRLIEYSPHKPA